MTESEHQVQPPTAVPNAPHAMSETPSWLLTPATGGGLPLPVQTHKQLLPLSEIGWDDFERLCLRLLRAEAGAVRAALYGLPGQAQGGIDMYATSQNPADDAASPRRYVTLQSRRINNVTEGGLEDCVKKFLEGKWAAVSRKFVYATSSSARSTQVLDKIEDLATHLDPQSITLEVWDQENISEKLKGHPELVHDFFGRPWVKAFCGEEAANQLGDRLDASEMAQLRQELARIYATTFNLVDPGIAGFGLNEMRRIELLERFVTPDLVSAAHQTAYYPYDVAVETQRKVGHLLREHTLKRPKNGTRCSRTNTAGQCRARLALLTPSSLQQQSNVDLRTNGSARKNFRSSSVTQAQERVLC